MNHEGSNEFVLSIITITFNNIAGLKVTIDSIDYSLPNLEHIVIDGLSSDGTSSFLNQLPHINLNWISERDNGIYDAMNKGMSKARGKYIIFMNAGDSFYKRETCSSIIDVLISKSPDVLYGETMYVDDKRKELGLRSKITTRSLPMNINWKSLKYGMLICHQSFIVGASIAPQYVTNNLSADIDWEIQCLKKSDSILHYPKIISNYLVGGISNQRKFKSLTDRFKVMTKHYGVLSTAMYHIYFIWRSILIRLIR